MVTGNELTDTTVETTVVETVVGTVVRIVVGNVETTVVGTRLVMVEYTTEVTGWPAMVEVTVTGKVLTRVIVEVLVRILDVVWSTVVVVGAVVVVV